MWELFLPPAPWHSMVMKRDSTSSKNEKMDLLYLNRPNYDNVTHKSEPPVWYRIWAPGMEASSSLRGGGLIWTKPMFKDFLWFCIRPDWFIACTKNLHPSSPEQIYSLFMGRQQYVRQRIPIQEKHYPNLPTKPIWPFTFYRAEVLVCTGIWCHTTFFKRLHAETHNKVP